MSTTALFVSKENANECFFLVHYLHVVIRSLFTRYWFNVKVSPNFALVLYVLQFAQIKTTFHTRVVAS